MSIADVVFGEDIVLDEAAFNTAISDFAALGEQLQQLRIDIEDMLNILKAGFIQSAFSLRQRLLELVCMCSSGSFCVLFIGLLVFINSPHLQKFKINIL